MGKTNALAPKVEVRVVRKVFGRVPEEHAFVLKDDRKLQTVFELIDALETMPDEVFRHHVNAERNDFASWLESMFDETALAADMRRVQQRLDAQRTILKHVMRELLAHHKTCKGC